MSISSIDASSTSTAKMRISQSLSWALATAGAVSAGYTTPKCRCLPGDACWPSTSVWSAFNKTVNGALIKTVPIGSPCHDPTYDAAACSALQTAWNLPQTQ